MSQGCCVPGCTYGWSTAPNNGPRKYMFSCRRTSPLRASWEAAIGPPVDGTFPETIWCCEDHFQLSDILQVYTPGTPFQTRVHGPKLRRQAVPSIFSGFPSQAKRPRQTQVFTNVQPSTSHNLHKDDLSVSEMPKRRTIPKRRRDQNICDAIYCEDCGEFSEEACWDHASHIENTPVVPLAVASLPECLLIDICKKSHENGVFSKNSVYPQTLFGPMVGALCSSTAYSPFGCRGKDGSGIKRFHLDSDSCCNWMRYVRFAKNKQEQNLMACMHDDEVYFVVTKEIQSGEELKVGYSQSYAEMLKECPIPVQQYPPEPVEPVGLPADWEPEIFPVEIAEPETNPVEIVQPIEVQPDPVEHQSDEEVNLLVRRSKRKRRKTRYYDAAEDDAESDHEESGSRFIDPVPCLPTDQDQDAPPVDDFSIENLSALIDPNLIPGQSNVTSQKAVRKDPVIKFPCTECFFQFPSEECLVIHNLWHDGREMNVTECPECGLSFDEFNLVAMHVKLHATKFEPREKCRYCDLFVPTSKMDRHLQNSHPLESAINAILGPSGSNETSATTKEVSVFKCDDCQMYFPSERLLTLHSRQHSGLMEGMEKECPECKIVIDDAALWIQHINGHGTKNLPKDKCKYCPCVIERGKMDFHVRFSHPDHYGRETLPCDICGEEKLSQQSLQYHRSSKHQVPQCAICAKIEQSSRTLSQHILTHREEDGFHCPHCTLIFVTYPRLNKHCNDDHLLKNVQTCGVCNKTFRNKVKLTRHLLIHSDTFEFICEWCGKGFHTKSNKQAHVKCMHKDAGPAS